MATILARVTFAAGALGTICFAQDDNLLARKIEQMRGVHIYGASVYVGASTSAYPTTGIDLSQSQRLGIRALGGDVTYGGQVGFGWQHHGTRTNLSATYSGGYDGMVRYSDVSAFNQSANFNLSRQLSPKWSATVALTGMDNTMAQYLFQPPKISGAVQSRATFDDFAAASGVGQFSNAAIASMLTGTPVLESPAQSLLLGTRILSYSGTVGLSYAYSSRLQFRISGFSAAGQTHPGGNETIAPQNYVMPRSTGLTGGGGFSYMLSPRTEFGADVSEYELWNKYQHARGTNATVSFGRKMGMHWFMRGYGGSAIMQTLWSTGNPPPSIQLIGGGSLGLKLYAHTLAASYDRSTYDGYGYAAGTNTTITGAWHWQHPGSRWSAYATYGQQLLRNTGFASISGWRAIGGISVWVDQQITMSLEYAHTRTAGTYTGSYNDFVADSIRLSFGWTPESLAR